MNSRATKTESHSPATRIFRPIQLTSCDGRSNPSTCSLLCDNIGTILYGDSQCSQIFGRPIEALLENNFFDLVHPIGRQYLLSVFGPELFKSDGLVMHMTFSYPLRIAGPSLLDCQEGDVVLTSRFVRGLLLESQQLQGTGGEDQEELYTEAVLIETRLASAETTEYVRAAI